MPRCRPATRRPSSTRSLCPTRSRPPTRAGCRCTRSTTSPARAASAIVSALHREMTSPNTIAIGDSIQTEAASIHGNAGGPLLNAQGRVIVVTPQLESDSGGSDGVGFVVPSNTIRSIASQLISSGKAEHAFLGVELNDASTNGAAIGQVRPDTPAAKAGLKDGDVVTALGGKSISTASELRAAINAKRPGDSVSLTYRRGGQSHTVTVKLASQPAYRSAGPW